MTHLYFTLKSSEIQNLIHQSVKDDMSKTILTTVFNQLMEEQGTQYINASECVIVGRVNVVDITKEIGRLELVR